MSHYKRVKIFILHSFTISAVLLLAGCVSLKLSSQKNIQFSKRSAVMRAAELRKFTHWNINGAFSIQKKSSAEIANYGWQQNGQRHYQIRISSALNLYTLYIVGQPGSVSVWRANQAKWVAKTPERLMQKAIGWSLPISELYYWIRGIPAPGYNSPRYDQYGHLIALRQNGWSIKLSEYTHLGKLDLPRMIRLSRPGLRAKIVIKKWRT